MANNVDNILREIKTKKGSSAVVLTSSPETAKSTSSVTEDYLELIRPSLPRRILNRLLHFIRGIVPVVGDHPLEFIRKCLFVTALVTLVVSGTFIFHDAVVLPTKTQSLYSSIAKEYDRNSLDITGTISEDFKGSFPTGMLDQLKPLFSKNQDLRGYITYKANDSDWVDISYPVVSSGDNDYYLDYDFQGNYNQYGAIFFDQQNYLESPEDENKVLMLHGHNMRNGSMFAPLNTLVQGGAHYLQSAPIVHLDTLYEKGSYEIFAVMVINAEGPSFDYLRSYFSDDNDFLNFVSEIRKRSLFNFPHVNITSEDQLLVLSTCSTESMVGFGDGRTVVVAKKVETNKKVAQSDLDQISRNENALMPREWYEWKGYPLPDYYVG